MIIVKAQYGLRTSGARWHDRLFDSLRDMQFVPSKAEDNIWMRDKGDHYEYISVYVDDLAIASRHAMGIIEELEKGQGFKLKGTGPITYHLGCDYKRDEDGTLAMGTVRYIERSLKDTREPTEQRDLVSSHTDHLWSQTITQKLTTHPSRKSMVSNSTNQ